MYKDRKQRPVKRKENTVKNRSVANAVNVIWKDRSFIDVLMDLGPGICTVAEYGGRTLEFDISEKGRFGVEDLHHPLICAKLIGMFNSGKPVGVTVRTFTKETVCIPHATKKNKLIRVPIKELRGYSINIVEKDNERIVLDYQKLSPEVLKDCYSNNHKNGKYIGLTVDERDHYFV